ncbi:MAG: alcohol dehydrogenase catalytic domain-containing protein [Oscillospiraceae bacterium]|jgi:(R,R)-butanediol dehydrogenase/meso-butanediol dehydrogenase/diacetyl reductase/L-iditol 2-dehydrogenase|nr:alcohol dehydrogenase catalytic domain-containing protein [Oscillospiraceae bacterium]
MKSIHCVKLGSLTDPDESKRGRVATLEIPEDPVGAEDVKIKVAYCSICGSDPHNIEGAFGNTPPFGLGHEVSGVIVELGERATRKGLKLGDRVAGNFLRFCGTCYYCRNGQEQFCEHADESNRPGFSEYLVWHESQVFKLPDEVTLKQGCLTEPTSVIVRFMDKIAPKIGMRVLVSGGGPIGLLAIQALKMMGATALTVSEPIEERRQLAKRFGADFLIDPVREDVYAAAMRITDGLGYDVVLDVSGARSAAPMLPRITAKGGILCLSAMFPNDYDLPLNLYTYCYRNELTITGTYISPYAFPRAMQLLPRMDLEPFTSVVYGIDESEAAFEAQVSGKHVKILVLCNADLADK